MKRLIFIFMVVFIYSTISYAGDEDILARVGNRVLTIADFESLVKYYSVERKTDLSRDEKIKKDILDIMVKRMALADMARKKDIDKRMDVAQLIELNVDGILAAELIKEEVSNKIEVTEDDMRLYYKMNTQEFKSPEMVRARHILIKVDKSASDEDRKKAKEKAEEILKRIKNGEDFAKLASEFSDDPATKEKRGDLGFFPKDRMVKSFEKAAFSLNPGEVSDIVETHFGYHIIKVEEKKEAGIQPFESVKELIRDKVFQKIKSGKTKELVDKAMKEAGVEVHPELITVNK